MSAGQLKTVVDACTLCDMCFMTKCPYVPPHSFDLDFPHLMLRARAVAHRKGETPLVDRELAKMTRNGRLGSVLAGAANWATKEDNALTRPLIEAVTGIDRRAHVPPFIEVPLVNQAAGIVPPPNPDGPAFGKKVAVYAGCHDNFNDGTPGMALIRVLAHNGSRSGSNTPIAAACPSSRTAILPVWRARQSGFPRILPRWLNKAGTWSR